MSPPRKPRPPLGSRAWLRTFRWTPEWRALSAQVRKEEPTCWLRLPGCTHTSTTADHIIPASQRPELALVRANVHGACRKCNSARSDKHAYDPVLRRPAPPTTTAAALRHITRQRRPPPAMRYFNNGAFTPNNGDHPTKTMATHKPPPRSNSPDHPQINGRNGQLAAKVC